MKWQAQVQQQQAAAKLDSTLRAAKGRGAIPEQLRQKHEVPALGHPPPFLPPPPHYIATLPHRKVFSPRSHCSASRRHSK